MRALVLHGINDLRLENVEKPKPKDNEVILKIHACGICSSDQERVFKTGTYHFPTIPGHEFAGEIVELGTKVNKKLLNRRASVFPLLPCMECDACKNEEYPMCSDYKYFGSRNDGGFSEYLAVPEWNLVVLDDSVSYRVGALMEPAAVSLHAVNIGEVSEKQNVAIIGTGTIGLLIGLFCKNNDANVFICGRRKESLENASRLGLNTINIDNLENEVNNKTKNKKMDVVFEAVGTNRAMEDAIISAKKGGRIVAVGNPKDDFCLPKKIYWKILRNQLTIKGTWNSDYGKKRNDWKCIAQMMEKNEFPFERLITKTYDLNDFAQAFNDLVDKTTPKTKLMFTME